MGLAYQISDSCGRFHTTAMDSKSDVWTFTSWGQPFRLGSKLVDKSTPDATPIQVKSGWGFSAVLTESGDVLVYWPLGKVISGIIKNMEGRMLMIKE